MQHNAVISVKRKHLRQEHHKPKCNCCDHTEAQTNSQAGYFSRSDCFKVSNQICLQLCELSPAFVFRLSVFLLSVEFCTC